MDELECIDGYGPDDSSCSGPIEYRMALSGTGQSYPRCDGHWERRVDREQEIRQRYPEHAPSDWSPYDAGEAWGENDY